MGIMVKLLAISLRSRNSTFAPSGWFMHAWSYIYTAAPGGGDNINYVCISHVIFVVQISVHVH